MREEDETIQELIEGWEIVPRWKCGMELTEEECRRQMGAWGVDGGDRRRAGAMQ